MSSCTHTSLSVFDYFPPGRFLEMECLGQLVCNSLSCFLMLTAKLSKNQLTLPVVHECAHLTVSSPTFSSISLESSPTTAIFSQFPLGWVIFLNTAKIIQPYRVVFFWDINLRRIYLFEQIFYCCKYFYNFDFENCPKSRNFTLLPLSAI